MSEGYPLVLVFYLDRIMFNEQDMMINFSEAINTMIMDKKANVMAFFLPTDGEERIECINPLVVPLVDMEKINKMVNDIKENFSIGIDLDIEGGDIEI